jgi:hypothetical protein
MGTMFWGVFSLFLYVNGPVVFSQFWFLFACLHSSVFYLRILVVLCNISLEAKGYFPPPFHGRTKVLFSLVSCSLANFTVNQTDKCMLVSNTHTQLRIQKKKTNSAANGMSWNQTEGNYYVLRCWGLFIALYFRNFKLGCSSSVSGFVNLLAL